MQNLYPTFVVYAFPGLDVLYATPSIDAVASRVSKCRISVFSNDTSSTMSQYFSCLFSSLLLIPKSVDKLFWWLLSVALWVVLGPPPEVGAGVLESVGGFPSKLLVRTRWVCCKVEHVTGPAWSDFVGKITTYGFAEGLDHVVDGRTSASTQIPCAYTWLVGAQVVQGNKMPFCQIEDVNVVTDRSAIL